MNPKELAKKIAEAYKDQKFKSFIILGEHNIGMSTYATKVLTEAYVYSKE